MSSIPDQGYEIKLVESLPERLKCLLCGKLMKKPLQTCRGEIACHSCYYSKKGDSNICPIDHEEIAPNQIFPDRAKEREILALACFCINKDNGCDWVGNVKSHHAHQDACRYRPVECMFCSESFPQDALDDHLQICMSVNQSKKCPYQTFGCSFTPNPEKDIAIHLKEHMYVHASMYMKSHQESKDEMQEMQNQMRKLQMHVETVNQNSAQLVVKVTELESTNLQLSKMFKMLEKNHTMVLNKISKLETAKNKNAPPSAGDSSSSSGSNIHKEFSEQLDKNKKEIQQLSNTITNISQNLSDVDLRHQLHENTIYSGTMIWKIDNYEQRYQQAVVGKTTALHSAPSFTDKYGYKFCARLYLNGDGMGKGTHMSLFFVLMKSEFDNLLKWPFDRNVSFTLINQVNPELNVKEIFHTEANSSSFKKPVKAMNIASGCPFFVTQEKLRKPGSGFIKDDCFFLEIKVKKP